MRVPSIVGLVGIVALGVWANPLHASSVAIPNGGFQTPDASAQVDFSVPFGGSVWNAAGSATAWQSSNDPSQQTVGIFYNSPTITISNPGTPPPDFIDIPNPLFITNMPSSQAAFLIPIPGVELHQEIPHTFTAGMSYKLNFGVIASIDSIPVVGAVQADAPVELELYYLDGSNNKVPVATKTVTNTGSDIINQTFLDMFELDVPAVQSTDLWAGKPIGIEMSIPNYAIDFESSVGVFDVGNLSLEELPEPASLSVLGVGMVALLSRRRRR